jgi:ferredoxin-type protein NapH
MLSERTLMPLAVLSVIAAAAVCLVLGKVFCAWGCPAHFLSRLSKKGQKTACPRPSDASTSCSFRAKGVSAQTRLGLADRIRDLGVDGRHGILVAALVSTLIFGFPVFCLICPVGLTFATVLLVMRLFAFGDITWTLVAFPLIIAAELFLLPRWCHNFCPLGALLSLFSKANMTFRPQVNRDVCLRDSDDSSCGLCEKVCPENVSLHKTRAKRTRLNECSKCRACVDACPTGAISFPFLPTRRARASLTKKGE